MHKLQHIIFYGLFLFAFFNCSAGDSLSVIDTPYVIIDTLRPVDPSVLPPLDSLQSIKKAARAEKTHKAFQFFSYLRYSDKAIAQKFTGVENYKPYAGKVIRSIDIVIFKPYGAITENCFQSLLEDSCELPLKKGQRFGNKIHFSSMEWFVRGDILFKEGDKVNPVLFLDTEKLLWERKKFKDVRLILLEDSVTHEVDVLVYLQDKLSWAVGLGYNKRLIIGISTYNFFKLPNTLSIYAGINFNKYNLWAVGGSYKYENILNSQINFVTNFDIEKLNRTVVTSVYRDFFSIKTQWAFNVKYLYDYSTESLVNNVHDTTSYIHTRSNYYSIWLAYALPVSKIFSIRDDKLKIVFGTKINNLKYKFRPFLTYRYFDEIYVNQENYKFGIGVARWDYYLARNAFYLETGEYFPRGYSASYWMGAQFDEVYGLRTSFDLTVNYGIHVDKAGYFYPQVNYKGYIQHKKGQEMVTTLSLDYVSDRVDISKRVFYRQVFKGGMSMGAAVPEERYFNINEENGIRGFYSPFLKGSKRFRLNTECDIYYDKKVLLTKAMTYVFCDLAWLSENGKRMFKESIFQYGVGLGIRLRSTDIGIPHVDFEFTIYPNGKYFGQDMFNLNIYGTNPNAVKQNNMFVE